MKPMISITLLLLASLISATPTQATTHEVSTSEELNTAIAAAAEGDVILLAAGSYQYATNNQIQVGLTLQGAGEDPNEVVVSLAGLLDGIISPESADWEEGLVLEGITFRLFNRAVHLLEASCSLEIDNCVFEEIACDDLIQNNGGLEIRDSVFRLNEVTNVVTSISSANVAGCLFEDNLATQNLVEGSWASQTISQTTMTRNQGTLMDFNFPSSVEISNCLLRENKGVGSGISAQGVTDMTMENCTVRGNSNLNSMFILTGSSTAVLTQCDILDNVSFDGRVMAGCSAVLICCDVDLDQWHIEGDVELDNSGCLVGTERGSLGGIKALYR